MPTITRVPKAIATVQGVTGSPEKRVSNGRRSTRRQMPKATIKPASPLKIVSITASRKNSRRMRLRVAPTACLTPISRVRSATLISMIFITTSWIETSAPTASRPANNCFLTSSPITQTGRTSASSASLKGRPDASFTDRISW